MSVKRDQAGVVLLIILAMLMTISAVWLSRNLIVNSKSSEWRANRETRRMLHEARSALIARAIVEDNTPGTLPCPANDENGQATTYCGASNVETLGRFPWKTLGMLPPVDGSGACLWYMLSPSHRNSPQAYCRDGLHDSSCTLHAPAATPAINPASDGSLTTSTGSAIAIIFSPGEAIGTQDTQRGAEAPCQSGSAAAFLESPASLGGGTAGLVLASALSNDEFVTISRNDVMRPVMLRALRHARAAVVSVTPVEGNLWATRGTTPISRNSFDSALVDIGEAPRYDTAVVVASPEACPAVLTASAATTYKRPASWLCYNDWYSHIAYLSTTNSLQTSIPGGPVCSIDVPAGTTQCL